MFGTPSGQRSSCRCRRGVNRYPSLVDSMASDGGALEGKQLRANLAAFVARVWAAGIEAAARRRVERVGNLARDRNSWLGRQGGGGESALPRRGVTVQGPRGERAGSRHI